MSFEPLPKPHIQRYTSFRDHPDHPGDVSVYITLLQHTSGACLLTEVRVRAGTAAVARMRCLLNAVLKLMHIQHTTLKSKQLTCAVIG